MGNCQRAVGTEAAAEMNLVALAFYEHHILNVLRTARSFANSMHSNGPRT